jgi:hypothetical protein
MAREKMTRETLKHLLQVSFSRGVHQIAIPRELRRVPRADFIYTLGAIYGRLLGAGELIDYDNGGAHDAIMHGRMLVDTLMITSIEDMLKEFEARRDKRERHKLHGKVGNGRRGPRKAKAEKGKPHAK